ncbi:DUF4058 family protein [Chloroflexi bacterium TSY]|nr:DUF4058 family protein [Chloroflexi bacterium TSY]
MNNQTDYPFPGMDPWLEHPGLWGDVHFRLIGALANYLSPLLTPHYYVAVGTHAYISTPSTDTDHSDSGCCRCRICIWGHSGIKHSWHDGCTSHG